VKPWQVDDCDTTTLWEFLSHRWHEHRQARLWKRFDPTQQYGDWTTCAYVRGFTNLVDFNSGRLYEGMCSVVPPRYRVRVEWIHHRPTDSSFSPFAIVAWKYKPHGVKFHLSDVPDRKPNHVKWRKTAYTGRAKAPLVSGLSASEWAEFQRKEDDRFARRETREITESEAKAMMQDEVIMGIKLPDTVDDWLRNHLFTIGDRPKP